MTAWAPDQLHNAAVTVAETKRLGLSERAAEIAVTTEITESGLHDLSGGDRDSAGLFQQRPSQGWGTLAQVTDPAHASDSFLSRLAQVPGWDQIAPWLAAQRVQISAFADGSNYQQHWTEGQGLADQLWSGQVAGGATAAPASFVSSTAGDVLGGIAGGVAGSAASATVAAVLPFALKFAFLAGGLALVIVGLWHAAAPERAKATATAGKLAPLAAL